MMIPTVSDSKVVLLSAKNINITLGAEKNRKPASKSYFFAKLAKQPIPRQAQSAMGRKDRMPKSY